MSQILVRGAGNIVAPDEIPSVPLKGLGKPSPSKRKTLPSSCGFCSGIWGERPVLGSEGPTQARHRCQIRHFSLLRPFSSTAAVQTSSETLRGMLRAGQMPYRILEPGRKGMPCPATEHPL